MSHSIRQIQIDILEKILNDSLKTYPNQKSCASLIKDKLKELKEKEHNIEYLMDYLRLKGCDPSIYQRGMLYRFHINRASNDWADGVTPREAAIKAVLEWKLKGEEQ